MSNKKDIKRVWKLIKPIALEYGFTKEQIKEAKKLSIRKDENVDFEWPLRQFVVGSFSWGYTECSEDWEEFNKYLYDNYKQTIQELLDAESTDHIVEANEVIEPKVGDFCMFWDNEDNILKVFGILDDINEYGTYMYSTADSLWDNCKKANIQDVENFINENLKK